ncbi:MAG: uracil-DNA glycosylase [Spirochaetia bacterium]|jgi:DNA polymerase
MTPDARSRKSFWKTLNLLEDWLSTGFSRKHPELEIDDTPVQPVDTAVLPVQEDAAAADSSVVLSAIAAEVASCVKCGLSANRTVTVPGEGALDPPVLFVGEGPGAEEDRTGRPFVGAAGQYLETWLKPIGLTRSQCFIANCVKCRPPQNREPHPDEIGACLPYLERQIAAIKPRVICCLGRIAAQTLLGTTSSLGALRGKVHQRRGIPVVVTYHPSAVLRDKASLRKPVWEDLQLLQRLLTK